MYYIVFMEIIPGFVILFNITITIIILVIDIINLTKAV